MQYEKTLTETGKTAQEQAKVLGSMLPDAFASAALPVVVRAEREPTSGRVRTVPATTAETMALGRAMDAISQKLQEAGQDGEMADRDAQKAVMEFIHGLSSGEDNPVTVVVLTQTQDPVPLVFIDESLQDWDREDLVRQSYFHFMQQQQQAGLKMAPDVALVLDAERRRQEQDSLQGSREFAH